MWELICIKHVSLFQITNLAGKIRGIIKISKIHVFRFMMPRIIYLFAVLRKPITKNNHAMCKYI